jgi:hypothetical protein
MSQFRSIFLIILALVLGSIFAQAEQPTAEPNGAPSVEHEIVLRISKQLLIELTQEPIEMEMPINTTAEGYRLVGSASGKGVTGLEMVGSDDGSAEFVLTVSGEATGTMRSDVGPATVVLSSNATLTSRKRIRFDGQNFSDRDPAETSANNCTTIDCIRAKHGGLIGHVVERIGRRMGEKSLGDLNELAEEMTEQMLNSAFDDESAELVDELNQTIPFDEVVEKYFPETKDWIFKTASRPNYLVAATGPANATFPQFLVDPKTEMDVQMELWLRLTPGQALMLEMIGELDIAYDLLRSFLPDEEAVTLAKDVKLERESDWTVVKIGLPKQ